MVWLREERMKRENPKETKQKVNGMAPENDDLLVQRKIALRAYELYLQRGGVDGYADKDWLQAEQEVLDEERH
jgi:Protein of unknown function (DUF2934)